MNHRKKPESTLKWFVMGLIPVVNLYVLWKVAKLIANHNFERGD